MRLTVLQLRKIIKEEVQRVVRESNHVHATGEYGRTLCRAEGSGMDVYSKTPGMNAKNQITCPTCRELAGLQVIDPNDPDGVRAREDDNDWYDKTNPWFG